MRESDPDRISQCLISFGSNLGTRESLIAAAAQEVARHEAVRGFRASRLFETPPIGGPVGQEPFLNAVAAFETPSAARDILALLQSIENRLGRQRKLRWDARSIDLDVVLHGELVGGGTQLIVPHPRYTARRFVLEPACDVAAHYCDPRFGWSIARMADHISAAVPSMALVGGDEAMRRKICERIETRFGIKVFLDRPPLVSHATSHMPVVGAASEPSKGGGPVKRICIDEDVQDRWVSSYVPSLDGKGLENHVPRLIARIQESSSAGGQWPAPHQMWPAGGQWPEYRLEVSDDLDWTAGEIAAALDSMGCEATPITSDGHWWQ